MRKSAEETTTTTTKKMLIFIKYEYLGRYGDPGEELYDIKTTDETTLKEIKEELNKFFIYGELDTEQYEIYRGGEQEDRGRNRTREPMTYYYTYTDPQLLDDDQKTLKQYDIYDGEVLHLKAKLKIFLYIPTMRYTTIYLYTYETLQNIQNKVIEIFKSKNEILTPKNMTAFYGYNEIEEHEQISIYKIYDKSTITIHFDYR